MGLAQEACEPCRTGVGKLDDAAIAGLLPALNGWQLKGKALFKRLEFKNFALALAYVNQLGALAEAEGHHPDLAFGWGYAEITLVTHKVDGLTRSDFVLAAKIDQIA